MVVVSFVPTQVALEKTCTPGAFADVDSGPVEKPWWLSASRAQHGPLTPLPLEFVGSFVNGKIPSLNVFAVSIALSDARPRGSIRISTESASQWPTHSAGLTA